MSRISIQINNISKSYGSIKAIEDITLSVKEGELFGFIGPDGAGKTTLFRILTTLLLPDGGTATLNGFDVVEDYKKIRNIVGYMPGKFSLYFDLTVEENLQFFATVFGTTIEENYELVKDIYSQIEPFKNRKAGKLSGGMKQKLALSCALIHRPEILILDEPTTGVDAVSRKEFWEMLKKLQAKGITIVVSTPYMDEATLCDRIALMQNGRVLSIDTPGNIISRYEKEIFSVRSDNMYKLLTDLRKYSKAHTVYVFGQYLHYTEKSNKTDINSVIKYLKDTGHINVEIVRVEPNIEDCFMELMAK